MSFKFFETGKSNGNPAELYVFKYNGEFHRYTSYHKDLTFDGATYTALPVRRDSIKRVKETDAENILKIEIPKDTLIADMFRILAPVKPMTVNILKTHLDDPDKEFITIYTGRVRGADWSKPLLELSCDSFGSALQRPGLRMTYQTVCNHVLYGGQCKVNKAEFAITGEVVAIDGPKITVYEAASFEDGWFKLGLVTYRGYNYMVIDHKGSELTLLRDVENLETGTLVELSAGCNKVLDTCWDKFNNGENFGGFPFVPNSNPFKWGI
ncbi:phage BR0599 family protein [Endozoicomonas sp. ALC066]|uniref:phage BR0599 family protein n=1 Tax=Endozoicomonas sp. ALC066 TaxID=3403078 RepID=UPI003BB63809